MKKEQALINHIQEYIDSGMWQYEACYLGKTDLELIIKSLEQNSILDKIKAEIDDEADYAYADFDRYKEDILHAESDELPDDDFRYGLWRAIEVINKYRTEEGNREDG